MTPTITQMNVLTIIKAIKKWKIKCMFSNITCSLLDYYWNTAQSINPSIHPSLPPSLPPSINQVNFMGPAGHPDPLGYFFSLNIWRGRGRFDVDEILFEWQNSTCRCWFSSVKCNASSIWRTARFCRRPGLYCIFAKAIRDRPFNLKGGGLWFFVSSQELEYFFFVAQSAKFFSII